MVSVKLFDFVYFVLSLFWPMKLTQNTSVERVCNHNQTKGKKKKNSIDHALSFFNQIQKTFFQVCVECLAFI